MTGSRSSLPRLARTIGLTALAMAAGFQVHPGQLGAAPSAGSGPRLGHQTVQASPSMRQQGPGRSSRPGGDAPGSDGWKWWKDPDVTKALRLSPEKAQRIEGLFAAREAEIRPYLDRLSHESSKLTRMTNERVADEAAYAAQVAQVESLWARLRESRTVMLYRMFLELQPDQYRTLQEIRDQRRSPDNRSRGPGPR